MSAVLNLTIEAFLDEFLIACPRCEKAALVKRMPTVSLSCTSCGFAEEYDMRKRGYTNWWTSLDPSLDILYGFNQSVAEKLYGLTTAVILRF